MEGDSTFHVAIVLAGVEKETVVVERKERLKSLDLNEVKYRVATFHICWSSS
jgi:hypothetical protein